MKIPFLIHSDGIEEIGNIFNQGERELKLSLGQFVGTNARTVKISISDYVLSVLDTLNSTTIPLLNVSCSSGDSEIFSLGPNPDVSGEQTLTLVCHSPSSNLFELSMMLDCSSLCQIAKATIISKPSLTDYLIDNPSYPNYPPVSSIFVDATAPDLIEVVMGTPLAQLFQDAYTKSEGLLSSSATLRLSFNIPSKGAYISPTQVSRGVFTNSNINSKYQNDYGGLKYDLMFDGSYTPTYSGTGIYRNKGGIILRTKMYKINAVGEVSSIVFGANCLQNLINELNNTPRDIYITPLPTSKATLSGVLDIEVLN